MALIKDQGLVIRRLDYSETSQVLAVLCRETGQQRLIAKGSKRGTKSKASVGIDLLEHGQLVYSRRVESEAQLGTLTEWRQVDVFQRIRTDLAAWYSAQYAADRVAQATQENDPHPELFDAFVEYLSSDVRPLTGLVRYLLIVLREIGLTPKFDACVGCHTPRSRVECNYFSARQGGLLCRDCEPAFVEKRRIDATAVSALESAEDDERNPTPGGMRPAFELLDYHLTEVLAKTSRVTPLLRSVLPK